MDGGFTRYGDRSVYRKRATRLRSWERRWCAGLKWSGAAIRAPDGAAEVWGNAKLTWWGEMPEWFNVVRYCGPVLT